ncbi:MAG: hypothetical protein O6933_01180 [Planctomycetota bacterium]|nr:hypothetical protein [Planctomycetota bacterium]
MSVRRSICCAAFCTRKHRGAHCALRYALRASSSGSRGRQLRRLIGDGGQRFERGGFVGQTDVGVPIHRQRDRRMPRKALGDSWRYTGSGKPCDVGVPKAVEVDHTPGIIDRINPDSFEVGTNDRGHIAWHLRPDAFLGVERGQERPEDFGKVQTHGLHVLASALAVGSLYGHCRRIGVEVEASRRKALEFAEAEARPGGDTVQHGAVGYAHATDARLEHTLGPVSLGDHHHIACGFCGTSQPL